MAASSAQDTNPIAEPTKIAPVTSGADGLGTSFTRTFPPFSITVLEMTRSKFLTGTGQSTLAFKHPVFEQPSVDQPRSALIDWILRGGIAVAFVLFGTEKRSSDPGSPWVKLFAEIGAGQWFRYFTGVVEIVGSVLVLVPWTVTAGLALLACTMAGAVLTLVFVIGRPADSFFSGGIFLALAAFWWNRRSH